VRGWILLVGACSGRPATDTAEPVSDTSPTPTEEPPRPDCNTENEDCGPGDCNGPEGADMLPGANCVACHSPGGDPELGSSRWWTAAGTIFAGPLGTVPLGGAIVRITGDDGDTIELHSNSEGNFYTALPIALPFHVEVESDGESIEMVAAQSEGGCNSCHRCEGEALAKLHGP
jgi:hypothetical protein